MSIAPAGVNDIPLLPRVRRLAFVLGAVLSTSCTYVRVNETGGDVFIDTPYRGRSVIMEESGPGDADADSSGDNEGADGTLDAGGLT